MDMMLAVVLLIIGILLGFGFFYIHFQLTKEANHQVMDERGLGRRRHEK